MDVENAKNVLQAILHKLCGAWISHILRHCRAIGNYMPLFDRFFSEEVVERDHERRVFAW